MQATIDLTILTFCCICFHLILMRSLMKNIDVDFISATLILILFTVAFYTLAFAVVVARRNVIKMCACLLFAAVVTAC